MSTQPQYTPDELDRFADVCAWCANDVSVQKNTQGDYVHFPDGRQECLASRLRKQLEKQPMEQARDCFKADKCPIEGHPKRARKDWFCVGCWRKLPADIQSKLRWLPNGWVVQWLQAMAMLKKAREKETNG